MLILPPTPQAMILEEMARPDADLQRVSRQYGIPARLIRELLGAAPSATSFKEQYGGWGRPELRIFAVSRTRAGDEWPATDWATIQRARFEYDAGKVEMCQGRDGDWIIQYVIPRLKPIKRLPYFTAEYAG